MPPALIGLALLGIAALARTADSQATCTDRARRIGSAIVESRPDGVSSDGGGSYVTEAPGVRGVVVGNSAALALTGPRTLSVNLNHPVPGGGGVPLGVVTEAQATSEQLGFQQSVGINVQLLGGADPAVGLQCMPISQTEPTAQLSVVFYINGHLHVLQMGTVAFGHAHPRWQPNPIHGEGTSSGTVYRASETKWVVDLPAGSIGRLFDLHEGPQRAVDKGLYSVQLRLEIVDAVPGAGATLQRVAERFGADSVVARYRALRRDSSSAYFFGGSLSAIGYWYLGAKRANDALTLFRISIDENPRAATAYFGLGEAYLATGDTTRAIANYRRAVELDPRDEEAADKLRRLGAPRERQPPAIVNGACIDSAQFPPWVEAKVG